MKRSIKNIIALILSITMAITILEIFLYAFHPMPIQIKTEQLVFPANRIFQFKNTHLATLDKNIIHTKNSLGFRGTEKPYSSKDYISILGVGGNTTECRFLNDRMDWVTALGEQLRLQKHNKVWVNNAGFDGHTTLEHQVLLKEHLAHIHPDYIIYLLGASELEQTNAQDNNQFLSKNQSFSIGNWLKRHSEIALLVNNLRRYIWAYQIDSEHGNMDLKNKKHTSIDSVKISEIIMLQEPHLVAFEQNLKQLLLDTKKVGITPIILTQPLLFGIDYDDITGVNLETIQTRFGNGKTYWEVLEAYNDVSRKIAQEQNIFLIDLAHQMPKSSLYFYDGIHFTNEGAEKVSEIIAKYDFFNKK